MARKVFKHRFSPLFFGLIAMLIGYPYFGDSAWGATLGGVSGLVVLVSGVRAMGPSPRARLIGSPLAATAFLTSTGAALLGIRGSVWSEASFTAFYIVVTVAVLREVLRFRSFSKDAILGCISVYLLLGVAFGSLFDLIQTLNPESFSFGDGGMHLGFRQLLFFSFMTLTTVGYGDIHPTTLPAQSFAILEGVIGVLYVAVLVGGVVGAYSHEDSFEDA